MRENVVPSEEQPGGTVGEDHVTTRVARRGDRLQFAVADGEHLAVRDPRVGALVPGVGDLGGQPHPAQRTQDGLGAVLGEQRERRELRGEAGMGGPGDHVDGALLALAEVDPGPALAPQRDGGGAVVAVHVGDQYPADVGQLRADLPQSGDRRGTRLGRRPSGVDEGRILQTPGALPGRALRGIAEHLPVYYCILE